jgi:hypothetical protein
LQAGEVAITGKPLTYTNLMEVNDVIGNTPEFNKLYIDPWITERNSKFTAGSITQAEFKVFFEDLFDRNFNLTQAEKLLDLFDRGIKEKDSLEFYAKMIEEDNSLSVRKIFLLEDYRNSLGVDFKIKAGGELIGTKTETDLGGGLYKTEYKYPNPVFEADIPAGATATDIEDYKKKAFQLNQLGETLFKKIAPKGLTESSKDYASRLKATEDAMQQPSRLIEGVLSDRQSKLMISGKNFSYENVMDLVLAAGDLGAESFSFNGTLPTNTMSVTYYKDTQATNKLYAEGWSNDASRVAKMTTSAPPLSVAAFQELFNGNRGLGVTGLFDEGLGLDQANKVLDLIDSGITDVNSLKFYGRLLDSGVLISTPTIKAFDNLWKKAEFAGVNVSPLGQIKTASGINVTAFSGGSGPAGNTPGDHLNHLMNILLKAGDPDPNIASQQSRYLQGSLQAGEVAITGKPLTYTNLMEVNDAIPDSETFDKLKIQYWTKGLSAQQLGNRNRQDLNRVFNRLYEQSNYNTIQEFQRLLEENGLYDPSGLNYYRELMEEMERGKAFTLDLATFDNPIASSRELDTYIDLNTANTRPTAARQIDEVWTQPLPVPLINSSHSNYTNHRQAFIDLVNATGSIAKTQAYFVSDIYGSLTNKDDILAYKDAYITGGASAHTLSELQKFRIDEGLSWPQAQTLIDLLEDPAGTTHAPDGIVNPQRARRHELLKEALAFGELPDTVNLNYKPLNYAALMTLLNSV